MIKLIKIKPLLIVLVVCMVFTIQAQEQQLEQQVWVDHQHNYQMVLSNNGQFQFSNAGSDTKGTYTIQNNFMYMQDQLGNNYQYSVQAYTKDKLILQDNQGVTYSYIKKHQVTNNEVQTSYPWDQTKYLNVLSEKQGYQWRERENQLYVEFLEFLIGQKATTAEVALMRQDFINEFNNNPTIAITDIKAMEESMQQVYSTREIDKIAMMREIYAAVFAETVKQKPEMNNYAFVNVLNKYVTILSVDTQTKLNLSNQDAQAYINYLQFQMMLSGQNYQVSQQQRLTMQQQLANDFNNYPIKQKQALAFASFIWNNIERQWISMSALEQQQYVQQMQTQHNIQNQQINNQQVNNFWNSSANYDNSAQDFVESTQQMLDADQRVFTMMQNSMTEDHVTMMNIINQDPDYEYVVDYNESF